MRIAIGQDESIFLPHALKNRYWAFDGRAPQRNKTEGMGAMTSLCITREFGWNFNLNEEELEKVLSKVNAKRKNEHCLNVDAAIALFSSSEKSKNELKDNPFYKEFDYGKNRDGCWDGNHTALQLEDVADFFCTLFSNKQCQIIFELDHSQCHKRFMKNAHVVKHFNLGPSGSVPIVRDVCAGKDSIGPCHHQDMWAPGEIVSHVYDDSDNAPTCNKNMPKHDAHDIKKHHDIGIKDLRDSLKNRGLGAAGNAADARRRCENCSPPMPTKKKHKKLIKGCAGMPIGLIEVLHRRGCIEKNAKLPTDAEARKIAIAMPDFKNEKSEIESAMDALGIRVVFTPKCYCEIAGRGIEYLWDASKVLFRKGNSKLSDDGRVNALKQRVRALLDDAPLETIQKCARRARECESSCLALLNLKETNEGFKSNDIEKMKKDAKGKRCALEQDKGIINNLVSLLEEDDDFAKNTKAILVDVDIFVCKKEKVTKHSKSV